MADNLDVTPGTGAKIATDEVTWGGTTVHLPLGKMVIGADNSVETLSRGQQTMANSLPVAIASDQGSFTVDTELPTAAALADATANPTTTTVGVASLVYNGTTWDRVRGDTTNGIDVDVTRISGNVAVINAGTFSVQDTQVVTDNAAFTDGTTKVQPAGYIYDEVAGTALSENDTAAARINLNRAQVHVIEDGTTRGRWATVSAANALKVDATPVATTTGGATAYKLISAATTNATSVKASAGNVYMISAFNLNAAARYLKLYNKASAPTVGTDTPVLVLMIPGNTAGAGLTINVPVGIDFATGIAFALTTGIADADTGAVAASEIVVNLGYK